MTYYLQLGIVTIATTALRAGIVIGVLLAYAQLLLGIAAFAGLVWIVFF